MKNDRKNAFRMHAGEPAATLLIDHLNLKPVTVGLTAFVLSFVIPLVITALSGVAVPHPDDAFKSFLETPSTYFYRFLLIPFGAAIMIVFYRRGNAMLSGLRGRGVVQCSDEAWEGYQEKYEKVFRSPLIFAASVILAAIPVVAIVQKGGSPGTYLIVDSWSDLWGIAGIYNTFFLNAGMYYFSAQILIRSALLLRLAHTVFRQDQFEIRADISHPDGQGGLGPIRRLAGPIHLYIFMVGLGGPINLGLKMSDASEAIVPSFLIVYFILGTLAFFAPYLAGREALRRAWDNFVSERLSHPVDRDNDQGFGAALAAVRLAAYWEKKTAEPYRLAILLRYGLCVLAPILLSLVIEMGKHLGYL